MAEPITAKEADILFWLLSEETDICAQYFEDMDGDMNATLNKLNAIREEVSNDEPTPPGPGAPLADVMSYRVACIAYHARTGRWPHGA